MKKILIISLIAIVAFITVVPVISYAEDKGLSEDLGLGDLEGYRGTMTDSAKAKEVAGKLLSILRAVGTVISVVVLLGIGIKYMYGSVEERSQYKETLWPWLIGAAIVFAGTWLPQVIYDLASGI